MVFNVLARNCDDHTKNFSFTMDKTGTWKLVPAFDFCHAYRPGSQHALSVNGKRQNISREDLKDVATNMNIKKADLIINHIGTIVNDWANYAAQTSVNKALSHAIGKTLVQL
jgi:serine/threonine-protein kinase HipA